MATVQAQSRPISRRWAFFFHNQLFHVLSLVFLVCLALQFVGLYALRSGAFLGLTSEAWFILVIVVAAAHQFYVWLGWRSELCFSGVSQTFGPKGFTYFATGFVILLVARPLSLLGLAIADRGSLEIPLSISWGLAAILAIPAIYTAFSVLRYFGFRRAVGIDHFDPAYRGAPLVHQGIFRLTRNAMYTFGLLVLWVIALALTSQAALVAALFSHAYVWVHYFCTERPDMRQIYGPRGA